MGAVVHNIGSVFVVLSNEAQVALASCYLASNKHELALLMYEHLAANRSQLSAARLAQVAAGLFRLGKKQQALEVQREWVRKEPDNDDAAYMVAHYMQLLNYPPEVLLPVAYRAFQLAPNRIRNRILVALLYRRSGNSTWGYRILEPVDIQEVIAACCSCRLQALIKLFEEVGDIERREACARKLQASRPSG